MVKVRKRNRASVDARIPAWIQDTSDQSRWNDQFIEILKRDYSNTDHSIAVILSDSRLAQVCATKIRSSVDKNFSIYLYKERKARGTKTKKQLETVVEGLRTAIGLCKNGGKQEFLLPLGVLADEFSQQLARCKEAFATKRHGRDRDHAILCQCHSFLEKELGRPVTYPTLTNLVNAGYEADENSPKEPIDEDLIRRNLANFKRNNALWHLFGSTEQPPA